MKENCSFFHEEDEVKKLFEDGKIVALEVSTLGKNSSFIRRNTLLIKKSRFRIFFINY